MDVIAAKSIIASSKENPKTTVAIKRLATEADATYSTLIYNSFPYDVERLGGVDYRRYEGDLGIKCRTFLRARGKLDRIEKIAENPEDHIFEEGGVSAD